MKNLKKAIFSIIAILCILNGAVFASPSAENKADIDNSVNAEQALQKLSAGNERFVSSNLTPRDWKAKFTELYLEQKPYAIILSCSDSRVIPEYIFDAGAGELFVIRAAGNIADPSALGSIEYAAVHLGSPLLVIMGHERCGAVHAAADLNHNGSGHIPGIIEAIQPAINAARKVVAKDDKANLVEQAVIENANIMANRIIENSSIINGLVKNGKLKVVTAKYFLKNGNVVFQNMKNVFGDNSPSLEKTVSFAKD